MVEVPAEVVEAAATAWAVALKASINGRDVDYLGAARTAAIAVAYTAGVESVPWHYGVIDQYGEQRSYGPDFERAWAYAQPVDDYRQLTVVRWRQGPQETAVIDQ